MSENGEYEYYTDVDWFDKSKYTSMKDYIKVTDKNGEVHFFSANFINNKGSPNFYIYVPENENGKLVNRTHLNKDYNGSGELYMVEGEIQELYRSGICGKLPCEFVGLNYVKKELGIAV